ncbi:hypothetical protein J4G33_09805 [Actinotalea sp. BY-33]|uniref:Ig-like domain-containing protein n=1 Tax=Actinotalea soli TaxID=2819234 RepID=A0A939LP38_9CELL|nr:hypothetical protein [Actinotalea soli]MBO1752097.1 hypothetical protein [Actinotalea soli]
MTNTLRSSVLTSSGRARRRSSALGALLTTALALTASVALVAPAQGTDGGLPPVEEADAGEGADTGEPDPIVVVAPETAAIEGDVQVGATVQVTTGEWTPADVELTYTWSADDVVLPDETGAELALTADHLGTELTATVTGALGDAADSVTATAGPVLAGDLDPAPTPTISGAVRVDAEVTALPGTWDPEASLSYQWQISGQPVTGATGSTYTPTTADKGQTLTVAVTGTRYGYTSVTTVSEGAVVGAGTFPSSPTPTISGTVRVGSALQAVPGTWSPDATLTYQWRTDGKSISGATGSTYTPQAADKGRTLSVVVTGSREGYATTKRASAGTVVAAGRFTTVPTPKISGTPHVGSTLKATAGTWSPGAQLTYQWKRDGRSISGANRSTYRLTASDHARRITVTVTGKRSGYAAASSTSSATGLVAKPFPRTVAPTISGTARVGSTLKATVGTWSPAASLTYQWRRDGVSIPGATRPSYTLVGADYGKTITVKVTGARSTYITASRLSTATAKVGKPAPTLTKNGAYRVGIDIKAGTYIANPSDYCYWERRDRPGTSLAGVISNEFTEHQTIVTIRASDKYFVTDGCGSWTRLVALGAARTTFKDGSWAVGSQIKPGLYTAPGGREGCYWERRSSFSGEFSAVLENNLTFGGRTSVRIYPGDAGFLTDGCGTWTRQSS